MPELRAIVAALKQAGAPLWVIWLLMFLSFMVACLFLAQRFMTARADADKARAEAEKARAETEKLRRELYPGDSRPPNEGSRPAAEEPPVNAERSSASVVLPAVLRGIGGLGVGLALLPLILLFPGLVPIVLLGIVGRLIAGDRGETIGMFIVIFAVSCGLPAGMAAAYAAEGLDKKFDHRDLVARSVAVAAGALLGSLAVIIIKHRDPGAGAVLGGAFLGFCVARRCGVTWNRDRRLAGCVTGRQHDDESGFTSLNQCAQAPARPGFAPL